jgi:hypothetical protein
MTLDLVRIQIEVLEAGARIIGQTNISMYLNAPRPFVLWPHMSKYKMGDTMDTIVVQEQMARAHFQSMGTTMDLITLGNLDFLLTLKTEKELFEPWIDQFVALAVKEVEPAKGYRKWCRIGVFDVHVDTETIKFAGWLPEGNELRILVATGEPGFKSS